MDSLRQRCRFRHLYAGFRRTTIHIDLHTHLQGRQIFGSLRAESLGYLQTVNALYPIKVFSDQACFITLNGANTVPHQARRRTERGEVGNFIDALLNVVFAKCGLSCGHHIGNRLG